MDLIIFLKLSPSSRFRLVMEAFLGSIDSLIHSCMIFLSGRIDQGNSKERPQRDREVGRIAERVVVWRWLVGTPANSSDVTPCSWVILPKVGSAAFVGSLAG